MTETIVRGQVLDAGAVIPQRSTATVVLFTVTAFVGAGLLFVVQPMVARVVLPSYGGSATVWSTSSLFFQVLLLLGYVYTHAATRRLGPRRQPAVHLLVLAVPLLVLPVALPADAAPAADASPVLWLLRVLAVMVGLPFLVVATTGPLLQRWYSWTGGYRAEDPYFLFAASNLGSFGGLLAYPFLVEPLLTLEQQRTWWSWGFVGFAALTAACGLLTRTAAAHVPVQPVPVRGTRGRGPSGPGHRPGWRRVGSWTLLAFLPSALMLAVTAHVTTDIAPIPLLWVLPLAIYLATFVLAFARTTRTVPVLATRLAVAATFAAAAATLMQGRTPVLLDVALNMLMLGLVAYAAHARLAADRPGVEQLTGFYLVVAAGGALGGLLNGIIAPLAFDRVWEYPLLAVLAPLALLTKQHHAPAGSRPATPAPPGQAPPGQAPTGQTPPARGPRASLATRAPVVVLAVALATGLGAAASRWADTLLVFGTGLTLAALAGWLLSTRRLVPAVVLALMFTALTIHTGAGTLEHRRTFFGSYRIFDADGRHQLAHGRTLHGTQWLDHRATQPTTYYAPTGPLGDVFALNNIRDVGIVGLGVGTLAAYGRPGQHYHFFEIDPEIVDIATDPTRFTYLRDTPATVTTTIGDGRLEVAKLPKASLDLLVLDAFSSDAIPVHLLTTEAMRTYTDRLRPGGVLAVHISNKVFDLAPLLTGTAHTLDWTGRIALRGGDTPGATPSRWVVLTADPTRLHHLTPDNGWHPLPDRAVTWTDDHSSILSVLR